MSLRNRIQERARRESEYESNVNYESWRAGKREGFINEYRIRRGFENDVEPEKLVKDEIRRRKNLESEF